MREDETVFLGDVRIRSLSPITADASLTAAPAITSPAHARPADSIPLQASPTTIAGYRDTFGLLLRFVTNRTGRAPTKLRIEDIDSELVGDFLAHIEGERRNTARSRNTRLAAIRSFFRFVAMSDP